METPMNTNRSEKDLLIHTLVLAMVMMLVLLSGIVVALSTRAILWPIVLLWVSGVGLVAVLGVTIWYSLLLIQLKKQRLKSGFALKKLRRLLHGLYPLLYWIAKITKNDKDALRSAYIQTNNHITEALVQKIKSERTLILLPHCLQWNECPYKVAGDAQRCVDCGKCQIGEIRRIAKTWSIPMVVATGGTLARKAIAENRPELIVAVACERDLAAGIYDTRKTPTIGILNNRPEGPCKNTNIELEHLEHVLNRFVLRNLQ